MDPTVIHYFDYKSPYAYLAQEEWHKLAESPGITVDYRPYTLDIPSYLGSAEVNNRGDVIAETRNAHQWRRVKYSYLDCRREANRRGLTLRGPRKIFDSELAHIGFLYAKLNGDFRLYHDTVYERFWRRDLDIENTDVITGVLNECGVDATGFAAFTGAEGRRLLKDNQADAEARGVFGVPSYLVGDELFWGAERFELARGAVQAMVKS